jgi:hypothetical protein
MSASTLRIRTQPVGHDRELALVKTSAEGKPFLVTYWDRKQDKPVPAAAGSGFQDLSQAIREFERRVRIAYLQDWQAA